MRYEYLNKKLSDEVNVLRTLNFCKTLSEADIPIMYGKISNRIEYVPIKVIMELSTLSKSKLEYILDELLKSKHIDEKNNEFKINKSGIGYLEYKLFRIDQLKFISNNPIKRIDNFAKILSFIVALSALLISLKNCSTVNKLEDSNSSITTLNPIHENVAIKHINANPIITPNFSSK